LTATFLWITGAFVLYTYIADAVATSTGWRGATVSALLLLYGTAAFAGNSIGGRAADHWGSGPTVIVGLCSLLLTLSAAGWACYLGPPAGRPMMVLVMLAWPLAGWALTPAQSHRLLEVVPTAGPEVLSLNTSAVYLGIAAGAAVGGYVIHRHDIAWLGPVAATFQLLALAIVLDLRSRPLSAAAVLDGTATDVTT
jgi:predicted MFS family arabinose efflux permease